MLGSGEDVISLKSVHLNNTDSDWQRDFYGITLHKAARGGRGGFGGKLICSRFLFLRQAEGKGYVCSLGTEQSFRIYEIP